MLCPLCNLSCQYARVQIASFIQTDLGQLITGKDAEIERVPYFTASHFSTFIKSYVLNDCTLFYQYCKHQ